MLQKSVRKMACSGALLSYIMPDMKNVLLLSLICAAGLIAAESTVAPSASAGAPVVAGVESRLNAVLQDMVKKNSEDFYEAAALVYDDCGDVLTFFRLMTKAAESGNPAAALWLSHYLSVQSATNPELLTRAGTLLEGASAAGYVPAMVEYAGSVNMNEVESAVKKKAMTALMNACRKGSAKGRALYLMVSGRMANGSITQPEIVSELKKKNYYLEEMIAAMQPDTSSARVWMERAAEHGSAFAPFALYQVDSSEKSATYIQQAVERHLPAAMGRYGTELVLRETLDIEKCDDKKVAEGLRLLSMAVMMGDAVSYQMLAYLHANGQGKNIPKERIYELFQLAHRCGDPNGTAGVGYCKVLGVGCKQDAAEGLALMEKARDRNAQWVNQALASMYFNGDGVAPDLRKAVDALMDDHISGSRHAYAMMAVITAIGNASAKPDPSTARIYLNMAIEAGEADAPLYYDSFVKEGKWRFMDELTR